MKHSKKILALLSTLPILMFGCNSSVTGLTGNLIGYAHLYDLSGAHLATSLDSGITVKVEETGRHTKTAEDGRWELSGLATGTYTISFSYPGYGTYKRVGSQYVGGGQVYFGTQSLYQIPLFYVSNFLATTSGSIGLTGTFSGTLPTGTRNVRYFVGTTSAVSSDPAKYLYTNTTSASSTSTTFSASISSASLGATGVGILSGQTVYIVAYAEGYTPNSYLDFATGRSYYPDLGATGSNILTVVVP